MPDYPQTKVNTPITEASIGGGGKIASTSTSMLKAVFASSPIHSGELTDDLVTEQYENEINGELDDGGHLFGKVNLDYVDPNGSKVETGGGGLPASPYLPNPVSPGEGNGADPTKQHKAPDGYGTIPTNTVYGAGGSTTDRIETSSKIGVTKLKNYIKGSSFKQ